MRKLKLMIILSLILLLIFIPHSAVIAHNIDLDPHSLISFPLTIIDGQGTLTISKTLSKYSLYYQAVEMSDESFLEIEQITNSGNDELKKIKTEQSLLDSNCNSLRNSLESAQEAYNIKLASAEDDDELESLKSSYESAQTRYNDKVAEFNAKTVEYNNKVNEINNKVNELTPSYIEDNWTQSEYKNFAIDLSTFNGEKHLALWVKLVSSNGKITYDEQTYTATGVKSAEVSITALSLDKSSSYVEEGNTFSLTATITPNDATNQNLIWSSNNEDVAIVDNGTVTGKAKGTATITVTTEDGKYSDSCNVTVTKKSIIAEKINDPTVSPTELPNTGKSALLIIGIILVTCISIFTYKNTLYQ